MDRALCVLNQQCRKLKGKPDDIKAVQKSVGKLFDRGHIKFLKDIPEDIQSKFIDKPVQHWIPWRIVHNPKSKSTPVRVVMDDGSGGRCLNDLVAKGRVESLNLVRLVLKFVMGKHAVTGDLSQFYSSLKLREDFFNLQRFLWRMNLGDMDETLQAVIVTLMYWIKSGVLRARRP